MTCDRVELELVAFYFGASDDEERRLVERHLTECASCLAAFLSVKRAVELAEEDEAPAPSAISRARLRRAVAQELGVHDAPRWWEQPVAFAVAASLVLGAGITSRKLMAGPGAPPHGVDDGKTSR
jgi:anti-sigma factor RsiW